jgi:hypothetical protein
MKTSVSVALTAAAAAAGLALVAAVVPSSAWAGGRDDRVCGRAKALFCEDFERLPNGGASSADWGIDARHGTLTVENAPRGAHGKKVLHVHTEGNGKAFLVADVAAPGNSFYGRVRVKVKAFPTAPDWAHYTLVEASGQGAGVVRPIGGQYAPTEPGQFWGVGSDGGPTGDWTNWRTSAPSVAGPWQCLEWRFDAAGNAVDVWIDGKAQPDLSVSTNEHGGNPVDFVFPTFDTVRVGWQLYQGNPTPSSYDLWYDDVVLSSTRAGCR